MKTTFINLRNWTLLISVTVMVLPVIAEGSLYMEPLGLSGWSAAVNPRWDVGFTVERVTEEAVIIEIQKRFVGKPNEFGLMPAIYIEFIKTSAEAVPRIIIDDEFITNDTTENWMDFHIELAVSLGHPEAGFDAEIRPSGDQFEEVLLYGHNGYLGLPTKLDFFDGLVL